MEASVDLLHFCIRILGFLLILNALGILFFSNFYLFLNKTFFIEPLSKEGEERVKKFVQERKSKEKRGIILILVFLGIIAIHWSFGGHFLGIY